MVTATDVPHRSGTSNQQLAGGLSDAARDKAFRAAARHSFIVSVLKTFFPLTALFVTSLYFVTSEFSVTIDGNKASVESIEIDSDKLKMVNPRLEGFSDNNDAYVVTAKVAYQSMTNPDIVELEKIVADVDNEKRGAARVTANSGIFLSKKEFLTLNGDVKVRSDSGLTARMDIAEINMKTQTITSKKTVAIEMTGSTITAREMVMQTEKKEIQFNRDVKVRIKTPPETAQTKKKPASPPSSIESGFGALAVNRGQPIDVTAQKLRIFDNEKLAKFIGDVVAVQGSTIISSSELDVAYKGDAAQNNAQTAANIEQIEARTDVKVTDASGRTAYTDKLIFNAPAETLSMTGNVILIQGKNSLKGNMFEADLKTGRSRFKPGGRVYGHFVNEADAAKQSSNKAAPKAKDQNPNQVAQLDFSNTQGKPISIESNSLSLDDMQKHATFSGNVITKQGGYNIKSENLVIHYNAGDKPSGANSASRDIKRIDAKKNVFIKTPDGQSAKADWAIYDVAKEKITVGGNVSLFRGDDVLKGERLIVDLKTGRSQIEQSRVRDFTGGKKRVRALFMPRQNKKTPAKPDGWSPRPNTN